jgi:filamentous hemagglutinin
LNGALTTGSGSTLRVEGGLSSTATLTVTNGFTNTADVELTTVNGGFTSQLIVPSGSTLLNAAGATISSLTGTGGSRVLTAALNNQGTLDVGFPLTVNGTSAALVNSGLIDMAGANLGITLSGTNPSFTNTATGVVSLGPNRTFSVTGGTVDLSAAGSQVSGPASALLSVSSATLQFSTATVIIPVTLTSVTIPGGVTIPNGATLPLLNSTLSDPVVNNGTLLIGGSVTLNGTLTTGAGSTLRVQGGLSSTAALTVTNGFTNTTTVELTTINGGFSSQLIVPSGSTLINAPGATILSATGTGGSRSLSAALNNQGTLQVAFPLTLGQTGVAHVNSGAIDLTAADLNLTQPGTGASFTNSSTGTITLGANRTFSVSGGVLDLSSGLVSGPANSLLSVTGATLSFSTSTVTTPLTLNSVSVPAGITVPVGATLPLLNSTISDPIVNNGTLLLGGSVTLNGALTTSSTSTLRVQGGLSSTGTLTVTNGFTNAGSIELTTINGGFTTQLIVPGGQTLVNAPGATISSLTGTGGSRVLGAQLDNQGTLSVAFPLTINATGANHTNSGTITIAGTTLTVSGGGTFSNTSAPGTIQGTGTFGVSGTTFSNAGVIDPGLAPGTAGTLNITGNVTFQPTSSVNIDLTSASQYDVLNISGSALTAGDLHMNFQYGLAILESFTPVTYASHTGVDFNVTGAGLLGHLLGIVLGALNAVVTVIA